MVEISQNPNIERIQDDIAKSIDLSWNGNYSLDLRATRLYNALKQVKPKVRDDYKQTKILIIFDNIWDDLELDRVGIPYERTPQFCCKVLFTSREKKACKLMGVQDENIVDVGILNEDDSSYLFWEQLGNVVVDDVNEKRSLENRLLKSCGGLPLAITALAKALRGQDLPIWQFYAEELEKPISCRSDEVYHDGTYKILEASYKFIRNKDKKKFFLLACLYPLGSRIQVRDLMRYGIGLDLFQRLDSLTHAMKQATRWAKELISSSLLLEDDNKYYDTKHITVQDFVKIHDVVRSYATYFAEKDGYRLMVEAIPQGQLDESYTAISLMNGRDHCRLKGMELNKLETLLLTGSGPFELDDAVFQRMTNLKVQVLSPMWFEESYLVLPKSITRLSCLKALHLENCKLGNGDELKLISELVGLVVLSLRGSYLERLPNEMKKLSNLRLLDLTSCRSLTRIPANVIGSLTQLEGLYTWDSYTSWGRRSNSSEEVELGDEDKDEASISELMLLPRLKVIEIGMINTLKNDEIKYITSMDEFKLHFGTGFFELQAKQTGVFEIVLPSLVYLWDYPCLQTFLSRSDALTIDSRDYEQILKNVVPFLDKEGFGFRNLEHLTLEKLQGLTRICDGQVPPGMFSNLRYLSLSQLNNLECYVLRIDVAPNLIDLVIIDCEKLKFIWMEHDASFAQRDSPVTYVFPCLNFLKLERVHNLVHVLGNTTQSSASTAIVKSQALFNSKIVFPSLDRLVVYDCGGNYEKLWDIPDLMQQMNHLSQFQNLKSITIHKAGKLTALGSSSIAAALVQLESLEISDCPHMTDVIYEEVEAAENENSSTDIVIRFPKLDYLGLENLDQLKCFYGGIYQVQFPALQQLVLTRLSSIRRFIGPNSSVKIKFPSLKMICVIGSGIWLKMWGVILDDSIETRTNTKLILRQLQELQVVNDGQLTSLFSPSTAATLVQLDTLDLRMCNGMKEVISEETEDAEISSKIIRFPNLKALKLQNLEKLECFYGGSYQLQFPSLNKLELYSLPSITRFDGPKNSIDCSIKVDELPTTKSMPAISNKGCFSLSALDIIFQSLRVLKLGSLDWKHVFSSDVVANGGLERLNNLEELEIEHCMKMEAVVEVESISQQEEDTMSSLTASSSSDQITLVFPRLRIIYLFNCREMRSFFSKGRHHVAVQMPSLEKVSIFFCKKMEFFSSGPIMTANKRAYVNFQNNKTCTGFWMDEGDHDINNFLRRHCKR